MSRRKKPARLSVTLSEANKRAHAVTGEFIRALDSYLEVAMVTQRGLVGLEAWIDHLNATIDAYAKVTTAKQREQVQAILLKKRG